MLRLSTHAIRSLSLPQTYNNFTVLIKQTTEMLLTIAALAGGSCVTDGSDRNIIR